MQIEGKYIVLDRKEYENTLDFLSSILIEEVDIYGFHNGWHVDENNERICLINTYDTWDYVYIIVDIFSKIKIANRFGLSRFVIETEPNISWQIAMDICFCWKEEEA
jgi:hypothetical protein